MTDSTGTPPIPIEHAQEIRRLSHDLSNALEIILQTSYLLGTVDARRKRPQVALHARRRSPEGHRH